MQDTLAYLPSEIPGFRVNSRAVVAWTVLAVLPALAIATGVWGIVRWSSASATIAPADRPEALCFALASPPMFAPPMQVEPSGALVRGRFGPDTPIKFALRSAMNYSDPMVLSQRVRRVGDFEVISVWLHLPGQGDGHWLVVAWMEGSDLAVCNFQFASQTPSLSPEEILWGSRLLDRILRPENFRAGTLPTVRLRATSARELPVFGPKAS